MTIDTRRMSALRAFASGKSVSQIADDMTLSTTRVRQLLALACRDVGMPNDLQGIRDNAARYLALLDAKTPARATALRPALLADLQRKLQLKDAKALTAKYVANLSASQLRAVDLTPVAVGEVQLWLVSQGLTLKHGPILSSKELQDLEKAIFLLDAYRFDVQSAKDQLQAEREPRD